MKGFFMKYAGKIGQMAPVFLRTEADGIPTHPVKREEVSSSMGLKCLVYNHKNTERKVDFAAENLENRKIRINTHTHTHTHNTKRIVQRLHGWSLLFSGSVPPFFCIRIEREYRPVNVGVT